LVESRVRTSRSFTADEDVAKLATDPGSPAMACMSSFVSRSIDPKRACFTLRTPLATSVTAMLLR
jgi:hypothetical protein